MSVVELRVPNLDCHGCASKLKKALFKLKGMLFFFPLICRKVFKRTPIELNLVALEPSYRTLQSYILGLRFSIFSL
ncbi:putative heavy metal-associated domain, HMA, heavy metal-associated domain superfamily [Helianthus annuus]|nr:putative heavy metal-associated domain, HMA, heavy metal-associated domain superfamily [Helianthus annuus]